MTRRRIKLPPHSDDLPATCDWGFCNAEAVEWRWADDLDLWLPVCRDHQAPR